MQSGKLLRTALVSLVVITQTVTGAGRAKDAAHEVVSDDARIQAINRALTEAEREGLCGVILVRSRNKILLHKAYGFADREAGRRMEISTGFDIGSIVKPMTAVAIYKLEEKGKLKTSDALSRFFPDAPDDKKEITLEQLLTHTAGMKDVFGDDYELVTRDWLLKKALEAPLISQPGKQKIYSNSGFSILAAIIEKVTGRDYEDYVRKEVLAPAGVNRIGYIRAGWKNKDLAVGYRKTGERWGTPLDHKWASDGPSWNLRGNGGMLSTAAELGQWFEALFDGKIVGAEALKKYLKNHAGQSRSVGGWLIGVAGGNNIFNSFQLSFIDHDFHMTFFTSNAKIEAENKWNEFRQQIFDLAKEAANAK
jgi:CubicO group peptidase (beta-lactamase class C family)